MYEGAFNRIEQELRNEEGVANEQVVFNGSPPRG